jgi:hypothetical protein
MIRVLLAALAVIGVIAASVSHAQVSSLPNTPFKLATYAAGGPDRVAMLIEDWLVDLHSANDGSRATRKRIVEDFAANGRLSVQFRRAAKEI